MKKPIVLVTGATGFIGKALRVCLSENGYYVRALTRQLQSDSQSKNNIEWVVGDITKPETLLNLCNDVDIVFHLAGFAHAVEEENVEFKHLHQQVNYQGTMNILTEAKRASVNRFIYFSSVKACAECDEITDEAWERWPTDVYGIAKREAENRVLSFCKESNILPIILRPALVYGSGVKGNLAVMIKGVSKGYFPMPPPIQNYKSMISLVDLCRATLLAAKVEKPQSSVFIVTDGVCYSTAQIVRLIRVALGKKEATYYLPLWAWYALAKVGDLTQKIIKKRFPINTQAVHKLFSNAAYSSRYIKSELQFEAQFSLQDMLPLMIQDQKKEG